MYNYVLMRLSCRNVFKLCFLAGTVFGGTGGILLGLVEWSAIGIFGGTFLGLLFGLLSGLTGAVYAAVFNALAPAVGGIAMTIEPAPPAKPSRPDLAAVSPD